MDWGILIKISHIIGTVLGVGGDTFGAIFYFKAMQDGEVDLSESRLLRVCFNVLHIGLVLLVISGFGYFLEFRLEGFPERILQDRFIAKVALVVILLINAILLQVRKIPVWLGGAISIVSWYAALILGAWRGIQAELWQMILVYIAAIFLAAIGERMMRKRLSIPL